MWKATSAFLVASEISRICPRPGNKRRQMFPLRKGSAWRLAQAAPKSNLIMVRPCILLQIHFSFSRISALRINRFRPKMCFRSVRSSFPPSAPRAWRTTCWLRKSSLQPAQQRSTFIPCSICHFPSRLPEALSTSFSLKLPLCEWTATSTRWRSPRRKI